jgi:hypothetical protein
VPNGLKPSSTPPGRSCGGVHELSPADVEATEPTIVAAWTPLSRRGCGPGSARCSGRGWLSRGCGCSGTGCDRAAGGPLGTGDPSPPGAHARRLRGHGRSSGRPAPRSSPGKQPWGELLAASGENELCDDDVGLVQQPDLWCAWLARSRFRVVIALWDRTLATIVAVWRPGHGHPGIEDVGALVRRHRAWPRATSTSRSVDMCGVSAPHTIVTLAVPNPGHRPPPAHARGLRTLGQASARRRTSSSHPTARSAHGRASRFLQGTSMPSPPNSRGLWSHRSRPDSPVAVRKRPAAEPAHLHRVMAMPPGRSTM